MRGSADVRFNRDGTLFVPAGYVAGLALDPVEKKPFNHVLPGARALSFGMLGCDLHCAYCQNWVTSQALRDPEAGAGIREMEAAIHRRGGRGSRGASRDVDVQRTAHHCRVVGGDLSAGEGTEGYSCSFVSNGNATPEVLDYLEGLVQCFKVDLKCFDDRRYRQLGGTLEAVLATIRSLHRRGVWVEVVTLVVPGL